MAFWNKLTYRLKTLVLAVGLLIIGFMVYQTKIKPTMAQYDHLQSLNSLDSDEDVQQKMSMLESELLYLDRILGKDRKDLQLINKELIAYFSEHEDSTSCELISMPRAHQFDEQGYRIYTHKAVFRGSFQELLRLSYFLETNTSGMKLASSRYFSVKNPRTKKNELFSELYIQSYEKIN